MEIKRPTSADRTIGERNSGKMWNIVFGVLLSVYIFVLMDFSKLNSEMKQLRDEYQHELELISEYNLELNKMLHLLKSNVKNAN